MSRVPSGQESKKNRNAFGKEVGKLLTKKDVKDKDKISAGLQEGARHARRSEERQERDVPGSPASQGKWPGGKLEDLKKDPKKDGEAASGGEEGVR